MPARVDEPGGRQFPDRGDDDEGARPQVSIRVDASTWGRLSALARRLPIDRAALAREAMRIGADEIERDPVVAIDRDRRALEGATNRLVWGFLTADMDARAEGRALPLEAIRAGYALRADPAGFERDVATVVASGRAERKTLADGAPALRWVGIGERVRRTLGLEGGSP